jgi:hypothetical protein
VIGCAAGVADDGPPFIDPMPGDGSTGAIDTSTTGIDDTSEAGGSSDSDSGVTTTSTAGSTDDGSTGEPTDSTGSGGAAYMCDNMTSCAAAMAIGGVSGDEPSAPLEEMGEEPTWLEFQVSEDNADVAGEKLSFTVTLTSPPGYDFDLYVFRGAEGAADGCGGTPAQSTNPSGVDSVSMQWGEGTFANNSDDSAWVSVEIRAVSQMCEPGAHWTLTVQGDT